MKTQARGARALKRCPFCGGEPKLKPMEGSRGWWRVQCNHYECGGMTWAMCSKEEAVQAWQRRAGDGQA